LWSVPRNKNSYFFPVELREAIEPIYFFCFLVKAKGNLINDFEHENPTKRVITSRKTHQKKEQDRYENGERKTNGRI